MGHVYSQRIDERPAGGAKRHPRQGERRYVAPWGPQGPRRYEHRIVSFVDAGERYRPSHWGCQGSPRRFSCCTGATIGGKKRAKLGTTQHKPHLTKPLSLLL